MNRLFVAALNGGRPRSDHPALPMTPAELAADAARVSASGASEVHIHPRRNDGSESLEPDDVAATIQSVRMASPNLRVSITTSAWIEPNPRRRVRMIENWNVLPNSATVNVHEDGAVDVVRALSRRGVAVEAGLFTHLAAEQFLGGSIREIASRIVIEPVDRPASLALYDVESIMHLLDQYGVEANRLIHGEGPNTWHLLQRANELGVAGRIGLEDTTRMPDGSHARDNDTLVRTALGH